MGATTVTSSGKASKPVRLVKTNKRASKRTSAQRYSVAEANSQFAAILRQVEKRGPVEITRHGNPVAILLSITEFEHLRDRQEHKPDLFQAIMKWREENDVASLNLNPDEIFANVRDQSPGREIDFS